MVGFPDEEVILVQKLTFIIIWNDGFLHDV